MKKLNEGGAVGHLMHLYDNHDLTFAEIKNLLSAAAEGRLENVSEKLDGMNLVFSWDMSTNNLRVARNSGDIKNGGMDAKAIAAKFLNRGNVAEAFNTAFKVLYDSLGSLSDNVKIKIFGEKANIWYSMELIYTDNPNVINYDGNSIVFHGWPVFEIKNGIISKTENENGVQLLQKHINQMQKAITVKNWKIRGPAILRLKSISNGSILKDVLSKITEAQTMASVNDSNTIGDYLNSLMSDEALTLNLPKKITNDIVKRCLNTGESTITLNDIKKQIPLEKQSEVSNFVKSSDVTLKKFIQPLEDAINVFAIEILRGLHSTLIDNSDKEIARLRSEVTKAIQAIESSNQDIAMSVLHRQMQKLGNVENIAAAMEGVVFIYKGNAYKFTGSFAPANQILGLFKYGRSGVKIQTNESSLIRRYVSLILSNM